MTVFALILLALWLLAFLMTLTGTVLARRHLTSSPPHLDAPFGLIPVSILKPLKGVDPGLWDNLESFFQLDYPDYELLFSVADPLDPAVPVVRELMRAHPDVPARLLLGEARVGPNPKINNLVRSYQLARHDWVLISDSNVRVSSDSLKRWVAHVDSSVGMVTSIVHGEQPQGLGGLLEATFLNTFYAKGMVLAAAADKPCVVGKCMLFQRSVAQRFGGIQTLAIYLAEDYMAGKAMEALGLKVVISSDPVRQVVGHSSLEGFWSRHLRWGRIRKAQAPLTFAIEPLFGSIVSGILGTIAAAHLWGLSAPWFFICHISIWCLADLTVARSMQKRLSSATPFYWLARELLAVPLWIHIAVGKTVSWRGQSLRIERGGLLART